MQRQFDDVDQQLREMRRKMTALERRVQQLEEGTSTSIVRKDDSMRMPKKPSNSFPKMELPGHDTITLVQLNGSNWQDVAPDLSKYIPHRGTRKRKDILFYYRTGRPGTFLPKEVLEYTPDQNAITVLLFAVPKIDFEMYTEMGLEHFRQLIGANYAFVITLEGNQKNIYMQNSQTQRVLQQIGRL